ncbi:hypothetical protein AY555_04525 [Haematospirillum jordaniae]|uniref:Uncharacterized protein n=3 Tax=Haematospirillum jordaniae TaxID=1549855 RepID=A0A143DEM4_9PROT|nr:hypothetical protein AY555_04525 [Haematospirillum jordaniae]
MLRCRVVLLNLDDAIFLAYSCIGLKLPFTHNALQMIAHCKELHVRSNAIEKYGQTALLAALLDDAPDAYIGTLSPLVTMALEKIARISPLGTLDTAITLTIHQAFGLPFPLPAGWVTVLKLVDEIMLATEYRDLLLVRNSDMEFPGAAEFRIQPEPEHRAPDLFLECLESLRSRAVRHQAMAS